MKWEYKVELTTEITAAKMNALGSQGWELVCVIPSNGYERELYWKRQINGTLRPSTPNLPRPALRPGVSR